MSHPISLNPLALLLASALLLGGCAAQQTKVATVPKVLPPATSVTPKYENPQTISSDDSVKPQAVVVIDEQAKPVAVKKLEPVPVLKKPAPNMPAPKKPSPKPVVVSPPPPKVVKSKPTPVDLPVVALEPVSVPDPVEAPVDVELDKLPIIINGEWQLNAHGDYCSLSTLGVVIDDGQGDTKIRLRLNLDSWTLVTDSDIDLSYPNTGLTLDTGVRFALGAVYRDTNVIFIGGRARMIDEFMRAKKVRVALGFWPTWPVTETKIAEIDISHFERAYRAWKLCQSRISAR